MVASLCGIHGTGLACAVAPQSADVVTVQVHGGGPVQFGLPMPLISLERGLDVAGPAGIRWSWEPLHEPPEGAEFVWARFRIVGLIAGEHGLRIRVGGSEPNADAVCVRQVTTADSPAGRVTTTVRRWVDGTVDRRERVLLARTTVDDAGEQWRGGEVQHEQSEGLVARQTSARVQASVFRRARVLPLSSRGGRAKDYVEHLVQCAVQGLPRAPGRRGLGDFVRRGVVSSVTATRDAPDVITNLEFDTTLGLARVALVAGRAKLLRDARMAAWHLVDRDVDRRSGLPYPHGKDHRTGRPEPGHAWVQGALLVALLTADQDLLTEVRSLAKSLARHPSRELTGGIERARDFAWPLLELSAYLAFEDAEDCRAATASLFAQIVRRWDPVRETFRFGEGEGPNGLYTERLWITLGLVVPAVRAHLRAYPDAEWDARLRRVEARTMRRVRRGKPGLPLRYRSVVDARGKEQTFGEVRRAGPEGFFMLAGLSDASRRRLLARSQVRASLPVLPTADDPALATTWSMLARTDWLYR